jgi:SAM-dependent methyltransferase
MDIGEFALIDALEENHWWYVGLHELIIGLVAREAEQRGGLRIFDAGCGTGRLCRLLARYGEVEGCDAAEEAIRFCRLRGVEKTVLADLNGLVLQQDAYDVVTSIDVLYHAGIVDDQKVLEKLRHGLRPGGMLILNLPAFEFLRSTHDIAIHTRERYTVGMVRERLGAAGFRVDYATYRLAALFPFIAGYRLLRRLLHPAGSGTGRAVSDLAPVHPLINRSLLALVRLENRLLRKTSLPFGTSLFVVARKPA